MAVEAENRQIGAASAETGEFGGGRRSGAASKAVVCRIAPDNWWGVGYYAGKSFQIRRIVSGRLLARAEQRDGERIMPLVVDISRLDAPEDD